VRIGFDAKEPPLVRVVAIELIASRTGYNNVVTMLDIRPRLKAEDSYCPEETLAL
jgi:hypothetical protein